MQQSNLSQPRLGESRRAFLGQAATLAVAADAIAVLKTAVCGQNQAPSANVTGANNRIAIAYIGIGKQGMMHVRLENDDAQKNNIVQVAACDLYQKHLGEAKDCYRDHRRMLERKDMDAVVLAPVDNWHAQCSIDALEAGKDVFCERSP